MWIVTGPILGVAAARLREQAIQASITSRPLGSTNDTPFPGRRGNTSFDDADFDTIITSVTAKLFTFPTTRSRSASSL